MARRQKMVKCSFCAIPFPAEWGRCPGCGKRRDTLKAKFYYPLHLVEKGKLDHMFKGKKEYMLCTVCKKPIKEEASYHDKKQRVFLHLRCHPKFMRMVKEGKIK